MQISHTLRGLSYQNNLSYSQFVSSGLELQDSRIADSHVTCLLMPGVSQVCVCVYGRKSLRFQLHVNLQNFLTGKPNPSLITTMVLS